MLRLHPETLEDRARDLEALGLNGFDLMFVELVPAAAPVQAELTVEFQNAVSVSDIDDAVNLDGVSPEDIFAITGGTRIRGGTAPGELRITAVAAGADPDTLVLTTSTIGDYSTYRLHVAFDDAAGDTVIDPLFAAIPFKFRPGCFNLNCAPAFDKGTPKPAQPVIDYLARDFASIKHVLINAMRTRVPGWEPTSEADLDMVLLDLIAADTDELCDFQDRVMQEAYLGLARKRVSLARHARLMDYHIHQGNQATTWLTATVSANLTLPAGTGVWTGTDWDDSGAVIFLTEADQDCLVDLNRLDLYDWGGAAMSLDAGADTAELALPASLNPVLQGDAVILRDHFRRADIRYLVIEEALNPATGRVNGRDGSKRQLLRLLDGDDVAHTGFDPVAGQFFVRVRWRPADRLQRRYCFVTRCDGQPPIAGVSHFSGNLLRATQGRPHSLVARVPGSDLAPTDTKTFIRSDEVYWDVGPQGASIALPTSPLAYRDTAPGGEIAPVSSTVVTVSGIAGAWEERIDLIESEAGDLHYRVETDELGQSRIIFGNGVNGALLDNDATVRVTYQTGRGTAGNVGRDRITGFDAGLAPGLEALTNPFGVTDGRDPEPRDIIVRRVPEAYRSRQLRAITLADYVARAEELPGVAHAYARHAWTGSWRTVQVSIDPQGTTVLDDTLRQEIAGHLDAVRLIGEDLEVRPARFVALDIALALCVDATFWPEDLDMELQRAFSDGFTADGQPAFFNPDIWSFGETLHASQLIGRALKVPGVERVLKVALRRWNASTGPSTQVVEISPDDLPDATPDMIPVQPYEIIQVANDPNHLEHGRILFNLKGGRR
ncbi:putative baseplate assembly protein [Poseidonocella pacifica]|uniref:Putative baseplate assembly protein n=1 Tax=Poseidonocella pacifica TaxID=871651 RepID=A0A1I0VPY0_9RHOB|nr:baseplate J/gp47 family protein [Poseidonocella pacifica]SFA78489.1 putative baseplate assembly protein [Poseidonocella pacifica]